MKILANHSFRLLVVILWCGAATLCHSQALRPTNGPRIRQHDKPEHGPHPPAPPSTPPPSNAPAATTSVPSSAPVPRPRNAPRRPTPSTRGGTSPSPPTQPLVPNGALAASRISVGTDGTLAAVDVDGNLDFSSDGIHYRRILTTGVKDVAVVSAQQVWIIRTDTSLYRLISDGTWEFVSGPGYTFCAASSSGPVVAVVTNAGGILVKSGYDSVNNFSPTPTAPNVAARVALVHVQMIYYIRTDGEVYQTNGLGPGRRVGGACDEVSAASDGTVVVSIVPGGYSDPNLTITGYQLYKTTAPNDFPTSKQISGKFAAQIAVRTFSSGYIISTPTASPPGVVQSSTF